MKGIFWGFNRKGLFIDRNQSFSAESAINMIKCLGDDVGDKGTESAD